MVNLDEHILVKLGRAASRSNKRAAGFGLEGRICANHLITVLLRQHGMCCHCDVQLHIGNMTIEHMVDMSKGGDNCGDNIALACFDCNNARSQVKPKYNPAWHQHMAYHNKQINRAKLHIKTLEAGREKLEKTIASNTVAVKNLQKKVAASDYPHNP